MLLFYNPRKNQVRSHFWPATQLRNTAGKHADIQPTQTDRQNYCFYHQKLIQHFWPKMISLIISNHFSLISGNWNRSCAIEPDYPVLTHFNQITPLLFFCINILPDNWSDPVLSNSFKMTPLDSTGQIMSLGHFSWTQCWLPMVCGLAYKVPIYESLYRYMYIYLKIIFQCNKIPSRKVWSRCENSHSLASVKALVHVAGPQRTWHSSLMEQERKAKMRRNRVYGLSTLPA